MSLTQSLLDIIRQEMKKHGATKLHKVNVKHGRLAQVVPDAMHFAFENLTAGTDLDGAVLELEEVPLKVRCCKCNAEFTPEDVANIVYLPCPECGEEFGHSVLEGKELYLDRLEAE